MTALRLFHADSPILDTAASPPQALAAPSAPGTGPSVRAVIDFYLKNEKAGAPRTREERRRLLELFARIHGDRPAGALVPADLVEWVNDHPAWASAWTLQRVMATVQRAFNFSARLGKIARNPLAGATHAGGAHGRAMTEAEFRSILRATDPLFRRVLLFLALTGARPGEMSALEWTQIDWARRCCTLRHHKTEHSRRDGKPRVIVLHPAAVKLLLWVRRRQAAGVLPGLEPAHCFLNARGRPWTRNSLGLRLWHLRQRLGIAADCKLYGLRHRFGTRAVLSGLDLRTLAELMGHTNVTTTQIYTHLAGETEHLQQAVERIAGGPAGRMDRAGPAAPAKIEAVESDAEARRRGGAATRFEELFE